MAHIWVAAPISVDVLDGMPSSRFGGATYSALAATALGHTCSVVGPVGADHAQSVRAFLKEHLVGTDDLMIGPWPTRQVRIHESAEVVDQETFVDAAGEPEAYPLTGWPRTNTDVTAVLTYAHSPKLAACVIRNAPPQAVLATDLQDVNDVALVRELASQNDWIMISWPSASELCCTSTVRATVAELRDMEVRNLVLKLGPGGAVIAPWRSASIAVPAYLGHFRSTVGAGDVFNSVFLGAVADGESFTSAGDLAASAAAFVAAAGGGAFGSPKQLLKIRRRRFAVFAGPEARRAMRVLVIARRRTPAETAAVRRICAMLDSHGFRFRICEPGEGTDELGAIREAHVAVVVDAALSGSAILKRRLVRAAIPVIHLAQYARSQAVSTVTLVRTTDERDVLVALYAVTSAGRRGLDAIRGTD